MIKTVLRPVRAEDLSFLHKWYNSDEAMGPFDESIFSPLDRVEAKFANGGFGTTWIIDHGQPIGFANFAVHPWDEWIAVIGVIIADPKFRGRGIGTSVHRLLKDEIFAFFPAIMKIEALTDVENFAEIRALEKAGFLHEGTLRRKNKLRGQFRDMRIFGFLREDR